MHFIMLTAYLASAVWGGDPVYPTVNYIQDPDEVIDYRGPDFHEPTPNMLSFLKEVSTVKFPLPLPFWHIKNSLFVCLHVIELSNLKDFTVICLVQ